MKIVMLCDLYDESLQYQENLLAKYYTKHGHRVTIVASTFNNVSDYYADAYNPADPGREYFDGSAKVIKRPYTFNILNKLRRLRGVEEILNDERPDLIFVHNIHLNLGDAVRYKRNHPACRIIMDYHADYTNSARNWLSLIVLHKLIRRSFLNRYRRDIDQIFPVVPMSAVFLSEVYGVPRDEMELLPLGGDTDLAERAVGEQSGRAVREALGIPSTAVVVFTGGRLSPLKETHHLLDAVLSLDDSRLHVIVAGTAAAGAEAYVEGLKGQAAGNRRVHFVGWIGAEDIYRYLDASSFAVFPASQSVLWQQALSVGLPLIVGEATSIGNQDPSYLNRHDNVIILRQHDSGSAAIAAAIGRLLDDPADLERRRAGARLAATELLDYNSIIERTLRV
jgi:glycosyltransferase involved in cell wall biosynthesis